MDPPTADVRLQSLHRVSDCLAARYPFPSSAQFDPTEPTVAYGIHSIDKILNVLLAFQENGTGDQDETVKMRENIRLLLEQLSNQTQKMLAISGGAIPIFLVLLEHKDATVRAFSARVLERMATERQGRVEICSEKCIKLLCGMLTDSSSMVQQAASCALEQATCTEESQRKLVEDDSIVTSIVTAIDKLPSRAVPSSLMAIANLCKFQKACAAALQTGIINKVVNIVKSSKDAIAVDAAIRCLISLGGHVDGKVAAIHGGAIDVLMPYLSTNRLDTRRVAGSALMLICVNKDAKMKAQPCIDPLIAMLRGETGDIKMNALLCLRSIAEYPPLRQQILTKLLADPDLYDKVSSDQKIHLAANRYV